ncbi:MAG: hypothetical protein KKA60_13645 [Proteobacteria bacterium]|nr:hypothetical protein [Pseudomonadota bacterium]
MRTGKIAIFALVLALILSGAAPALPCLCASACGHGGPARNLPVSACPMEPGPDDCCAPPDTAQVPDSCCGGCISTERDLAERLAAYLPLPTVHPQAAPAVVSSIRPSVITRPDLPDHGPFSVARAAPMFILFRSLIL